MIGSLTTTELEEMETKTRREIAALLQRFGDRARMTTEWGDLQGKLRRIIDLRRAHAGEASAVPVNSTSANNSMSS